ncbi:Protein kinase APK1A [Forsythia ovata]|uniref:Protein kinase APK1A n=1 Tax=Forsythia ovata TaxID=205694 RepID=A0ABD1U628_9LAMI
MLRSYREALTAKSDIYSFGMVLLEILSGKKVTDKNRPLGEHNLVEWANPYPMNKRRMLCILEPRLEGQYSSSQALKAATLALQYMCKEPKLRPNMDEVVIALEQLQESKGTSKNDQTNHQFNRHNQPHRGRRSSCQSSAEETRGVAAYPRPSASTLYA